MKQILILTIIVLISINIFSQNEVLYSENFESGYLQSNTQKITTGQFKENPSIKPCVNIQGKKAFGFGRSNCNVDCDKNTATLKITFDNPSYVYKIEFKDIEKYGNWGSNGAVFIDGKIDNSSFFGRNPVNDNKTDNNYYNHIVTVNKKVKTIEFKVIAISSKSEIFIDDIVVYGCDVVAYLTQQIYNRQFNILRASHILIMVDKNASQKDTLLAYNKAKKIQKRLLAGEDFTKLAKEISDDPSVKNNGGDLGYFSIFQMVYPFENAVYRLKVGEISNPVRTKYGYHIIKLTDKKTNFGKIKVAHIMIATFPSMKEEERKKAKEKIFDIFSKLKNGEDFGELAKKYSDDKGSSRKGGELPWFGTGRMVPEFENVAVNLKNIGDYSHPIKTKFGWHIIKLIEKKEFVPKSKSEIQHMIIKKLSKYIN